MRANLDYPRFAIAGLSLFLMGSFCRPASAVLINAQFTTSGSAGDWVSFPTQTGPAVIGSAGDYWNAISGTSISVVQNLGPLALNDNSGNATPVQLDMRYRGFFGKRSGSPLVWQFEGTPYASLMNQYTYAENDEFAFVRLRNVPNGSYDLYLYSSPSPDAITRVTEFAVSTDTQSLTADVGPYAGATTFMEGVNYAHFRVNVGSGSIVILFDGLGDGPPEVPHAPEADINGFQLISAPEPASALLVSLALAGGLLRRRRKMAGAAGLKCG